MAAKVAKIQNAKPGEQDLTFYCPGCGFNHGVITKERSQSGWDWNGSFEKPTLHPSILTWGTNSVIGDDDSVEAVPFRCHSFVREGKIQYLSDCSHDLAGKTIDMENI